MTDIDLSELTNPARYDDPEWMRIHRDLEAYAIDKHCFRHTSGQVYRKGWEWTHCLFGLQQLGAITPSASAVGVGVGREPVIFYLADRIAAVVATDMYDNGAWSTSQGKEASREMVEVAKANCPASTDFSRIRFENQDGTRLTYDDDRFDIAWSLSSIEHFGGHGAACKALSEMGRVVRPGGIVAVATEVLLLDDQEHGEYFNRRALFEELIEPCQHLELIGRINFDTLPKEYLVDSVVFPHGAERLRRHVVLNDGQVQWTSLMMFFRKIRAV